MENIETFLESKSSQAIDQICEITIESERYAYQSKLESFDAYKERQKQVLQQRFKDLQDEYLTAYEVCFEHLIGSRSAKEPLSRSEKEKILYEIKKGQQNLLKAMQSNTLENSLSTDKTFQDILEYSDFTLEQFYFVGIECIENKEFRKAKDVFILLTLINPGYPNFWVSLALCQQALEDWNAALQACSIAETLDVRNPLPYLYASECYAKLQDHPHAMEEANKAIEYANENNEASFAEIKAMIIEWKEQLVKIAC